MFSAREFRTMAREKLKGHWGKSVLVSLVALLLGGIPGSSGNAGSAAGGSSASSAAGGTTQFEGYAEGSFDSMQDLGGQLMDVLQANPLLTGILVSIVGTLAVIGLVMFLIGGAVELGHNCYYVGLCNNLDPAFGTLFSRFNIFFKALGLRLFMSLFVLLWTLLLVIPGIIAGYRYAMAPYIMAQDPNVGIREAVNRSKEMMQGRKWRFFCLQLSFIGWMILCACTLGIGSLWLTPYQQAAYAAFYLDASGQGIPLANA